MRRERFNLDLSNVAWLDGEADPAMPTLDVSFEGSAASLRDHLAGPKGDPLAAEQTDLTVRLHGDLDEPDTDAVVALTDRVTGDYVIELTVDVADLSAFVRAANRYGEHADSAARYRVRLSAGDETVATYEKRTLLVYSNEGELLREHSLIPSGVEI